jgi:hypothetical protein
MSDNTLLPTTSKELLSTGSVTVVSMSYAREHQP